MSEEQFYQLALCFADQIGPVVSRTLVEHCGSARSVFKEKQHLLRRIPRVGGIRLQGLKSKSTLLRAEREMDFILKEGIGMLFFQDEAYPRRLLHCADAPVLLFQKGVADLNPAHALAVVGTRNQSNYGKRATEQLVKDCSIHTPLIVSGLALGVDTTAHEAALRFHCETVAVLGHGLDRLYPYQNKKLAEKIMTQGSLLTEFPSGTKPDAINFPKRNRIVAGMCDATIVVEAAEKGGALITGELASGYQRDVFALPGRVSDPMSKGCLNLIKNHQAHVLTDPQDIIEMLGWENNLNRQSVQIEIPIDLSTEEAQVMSTLGNEQMEIDRISLQSGMTLSQLYALLTALELRGLIKALPGKRYEVV